MSARPCELTFGQAWLSDALTGEFKPPESPNDQTHTIGMLASATVKKGRMGFSQAIHDGKIVGDRYVYRPSWNPDVEVAVLCNDFGRPDFKQATLESEFGNRLSIAVVPDTTLNIVADGDLYEIPYADERTGVAREAVVELATEFFRDVYRSNALN